MDKACLTSVPTESMAHPAVEQSDVHSIKESEWSDIQTSEARIADVREVAPDTDAGSHDIPVVTFPMNGHQTVHGSSDNQL